MKHFIYFTFVTIILSSCNGKSSEDTFSAKLSDITKNETWLIGENDKAIESVLELIEDNPESLDYKLWEWETEEYMWERLIKTTTSDDGNVRVYNINSIVPDGMHSFYGTWIIQYRINGSIYTDIWDEMYSSVNDVYSVQGANKTYYLFVDHSSHIRQGEFYDEAVTAYSINTQTHKFQEEKLFKTTKELLSSIDISWMDYNYIDDSIIHSELNHIHYYRESLFIPLVTKKGIMTEGYLLYAWDSTYFKFKEIAPIVEFKAKEYTIRIDILSDGRYKYSSWGKNKSTEQTPDLILYNGKMKCWNEIGSCNCNDVYDNGESSLSGRTYTFENNGYLYRFKNGWWKGHFYEDFTISKGDEEILSATAEIIRQV